MDLELVVKSATGERHVKVLCRIDTLDEIAYYKNGGILHYVLRQMAKAA
jgi:aconitate hydratase